MEFSLGALSGLESVVIVNSNMGSYIYVALLVVKHNYSVLAIAAGFLPQPEL